MQSLSSNPPTVCTVTHNLGTLSEHLIYSSPHPVYNVKQADQHGTAGMGPPHSKLRQAQHFSHALACNILHTCLLMVLTTMVLTHMDRVHGDLLDLQVPQMIGPKLTKQQTQHHFHTTYPMTDSLEASMILLNMCMVDILT